MHVVLAILALGGAAAWALRAGARTYKSPLPRYARRIPLIAQGGAAGRFAMLAAPSSARGLVLLELKSALFETVTHRFGLEAEPPPDVLLRLLAGVADDPSESHSTLVRFSTGRPHLGADQPERAPG